MQYSFSPCPLLSKLSDLVMYLIAAVSAVSFFGDIHFGWNVGLSNKASSTLAITIEDETTTETEN
ncbi:hypothetical protein [Nostoc sp. ChiQUE01b]|uniref:hypothetical protein n=1 Tax=Nostoc sp. ChiQUE01b TaxID=3075376 RepID=UPI002AD1ED98|nr:hypothetical protein [Nostoc sp. ChiQUE01b]